MRLLFLGAGAIGGYFGGRLAEQGADVTFLVRPERAATLASHGLSIVSPLGNAVVEVKAITEVSTLFDTVILACKAYDLDAAIAAITPAVGPETLILPLLNGVKHLDVLDARFGRDHVAGGLCHIGAARTPSGEIRHLNRLQRFVLGPRSKRQFARCRDLHEELKRGEFAPLLSETIEQEMWDKFVLLTAYAGITCLMRAPIGVIAATEDGAALAGDLLDECAAVGKKVGYEPRAGFIAETRAMLTERGSIGTASMLRDIQGGGRTEGDTILGDMLARADGLPVPLLRIARAHVQAYEIQRSMALA